MKIFQKRAKDAEPTVDGTLRVKRTHPRGWSCALPNGSLLVLTARDIVQIAPHRFRMPRSLAEAYGLVAVSEEEVRT